MVKVFNIVCGRLEQAKITNISFFMNSITLLIRMWRILFYTFRILIFTSRKVKGCLILAAIDCPCVPNMLNRNKIRRKCWLLHSLYCYSFNDDLHKMICMQSDNITRRKNEIPNYCSVK